MNTVSDYWEDRFRVGVVHHSKQNRQISRDFLKAIRTRKTFAEAFRCDSIIEIGGGTGEFIAAIAALYKTRVVYGTDLALDAVKVARTQFPDLRFETFDILNDWPTGLANFDLALASNVLEHFRKPFIVLDRMLELAKKAVVLVPYRQACTDGYHGEGGAGHVYRFTKGSFSTYRVIDAFTFSSDGWQHRAKRERPLQLAVLIERR